MKTSLINAMNASALLAGVLLASSAAAMDGIDWIPVGHPGNGPDGTGYGAVAYAYEIGRHEVTNAQYTGFLNAVDPTGANPHGIYNSNMGSNPRGGIAFAPGAANGAKYSVRANMGDKPVNYVSWYDAARFTNWLNNGEGAASTETGTYTLAGNSGMITRNSGPEAKVWLPSENEWYKAAYFDPTPGAGGGDNYWRYPTQSNAMPVLAAADATGRISNPGPNVANSFRGADWNGQDGNVTAVGSAGANNYFGTADQAGNVWEWNEAEISASTRGLRGGSWTNVANFQTSSTRIGNDPLTEKDIIGFRVARVEAADYDYEISNGKVTITLYKGRGGEVTIPETIEGLPVTGIEWSGHGAFEGRSDVTGVVLPQSLQYIGWEAFRDSGLTHVEFPERGVALGIYAFSGCTSLTHVDLSRVALEEEVFSDCTSLTSVILPNCRIIWLRAFAGCSSLTSIHIPASVETIEYCAFQGCASLTSIVLPASVSFIDTQAFDGCTSLTTAIFLGHAPLLGEDPPDWRVFSGAAPSFTVYYLSGSSGFTTPLWETYPAFPLANSREFWRLTHFGTTANTGDAADAADPDFDGLNNLLEFAFGLHPLQPGAGQTPQWERAADSLVCSFAKPAGVDGITYRAEWSATMDRGTWQPLPDTGTGNQHTFTLPLADGERKFARLKVSSP